LTNEDFKTRVHAAKMLTAEAAEGARVCLRDVRRRRPAAFYVTAVINTPCLCVAAAAARRIKPGAGGIAHPSSARRCRGRRGVSIRGGLQDPDRTRNLVRRCAGGGERLKTRDLTSRDHWNCGGWHCKTGQRGTILQGWTSRDLFNCASRSSS